MTSERRVRRGRRQERRGQKLRAARGPGSGPWTLWVWLSSCIDSGRAVWGGHSGLTVQQGVWGVGTAGRRQRQSRLHVLLVPNGHGQTIPQGGQGVGGAEPTPQELPPAAPPRAGPAGLAACPAACPSARTSRDPRAEEQAGAACRGARGPPGSFGVWRPPGRLLPGLGGDFGFLVSDKSRPVRFFL